MRKYRLRALFRGNRFLLHDGGFPFLFRVGYALQRDFQYLVDPAYRPDIQVLFDVSGYLDQFEGREAIGTFVQG